MKFGFSVLQTQDPYISSVGTIHHQDPLTIYDGSNDQSTQIAKLSGNLGSFSISSTGNSLLVKFESYIFFASCYKWYDYDGFFATIHYGTPYLNIK